MQVARNLGTIVARHLRGAIAGEAGELIARRRRIHRPEANAATDRRRLRTGSRGWSFSRSDSVEDDAGNGRPREIASDFGLADAHVTVGHKQDAA